MICLKIPFKIYMRIHLRISARETLTIFLEMLQFPSEFSVISHGVVIKFLEIATNVVVFAVRRREF